MFNSPNAEISIIASLRNWIGYLDSTARDSMSLN